jgi:hypothetical protein
MPLPPKRKNSSNRNNGDARSKRLDAADEETDNSKLDAHRWHKIKGEQGMKPITFTPKMIQAIENQTKTQTRRVLRKGAQEGDPCPYGGPGDRLWIKEHWAIVKYQPGRGYGLAYKADKRIEGLSASTTCIPKGVEIPSDLLRWVPEEQVRQYDVLNRPLQSWQTPLFMPQWASRLTLEITTTRLERLQQIQEADLLAEGLRTAKQLPLKGLPSLLSDLYGEITFDQRNSAKLWNEMSGSRVSWDSNPLTWVITFRLVS